MKKAIAITMFLSIFFAGTAFAEDKDYLLYEGFLIDAGGFPVTSPEKGLNITFRFYDAETDGQKIWEKIYPAVVMDGFFWVQFEFDKGFFDGQDLFLTLQVEGDVEMSPSQQVVPVPSAHYSTLSEVSNNAKTLEGKKAQEFALSTHNHDWSQVVDGSKKCVDAVAAAGYILDGMGKINKQDDFNFTVSTHVTNLDADFLDGKDSTQFALTGHNHDSTYSSLTHNHDDAYAPTIHNHDSAYALLGHNHDSVYLKNGAGQIDNLNDFNFTSPIHIPNLDADTLDGKNSTEFADATHNHLWANITDADVKAVAAVDAAGYIQNGDTITGLKLNFTPSNTLDAANKSYVDTSVSSLTANDATFQKNVNINGFLTLANAPSNSSHAATKGYVDSAIDASLRTFLNVVPAGYSEIFSMPVMNRIPNPGVPLRNAHASAFDGKYSVYVHGGTTADLSKLGDVWKFTTENNSWTPVDSASLPRSSHTLSYLQNTANPFLGEALFTYGGYDQSENKYDYMLILNLFSTVSPMQWQKMASYSPSRSYTTATAYKGKIYFFGGYTDLSGNTNELMVYSPPTEVKPYGEWQQLYSHDNAEKYCKRRYQHTAALIGEKIYFIGGNCNSGYCMDSCVYDTGTQELKTLHNSPFFGSFNLLATPVTVNSVSKIFISYGLSNFLYDPVSGVVSVDSRNIYGRYWATGHTIKNTVYYFFGRDVDQQAWGNETISYALNKIIFAAKQ
jgi:hypothetical protein